MQVFIAANLSNCVSSCKVWLTPSRLVILHLISKFFPLLKGPEVSLPCSLVYPKSDETITLFMLALSFHILLGLPSGLWLSGFFSAVIVYAFFISSACSTRPSHSLFSLNVITCITPEVTVRTLNMFARTFPYQLSAHRDAFEWKSEITLIASVSSLAFPFIRQRKDHYGRLTSLSDKKRRWTGKEDPFWALYSLR